MKNKIAIIFFLLATSLLFSQEETNKKSFFKTLWGQAPTNTVTYMPVGVHTFGGKIHKPHEVQYIGVNYKVFEVAAFINSYEDWSAILMYKRQILISNRWSLDYGAGIIYGYKGNLETQPGIPFPKTLFSGAINPIVGGGVNYRIYKKIYLAMLIAPQITIYGVKYNF